MLVIWQAPTLIDYCFIQFCCGLLEAHLNKISGVFTVPLCCVFYSEKQRDSVCEKLKACFCSDILFKWKINMNLQ